MTQIHNWTHAEVEFVCRLSEDFFQFASLMLLYPSEHISEVLLSDDQYPIFPCEALGTVAAWVLWRMTFVENNFAWSHGNFRQPVITSEVFRSMVKRLPEIVRPRFTSQNRTYLTMDSYSSLSLGTARNTYIYRGRALSHVVMSDVEPFSEIYHRHVQDLLPQMTFVPKMKMICIAPKEK